MTRHLDVTSVDHSTQLVIPADTYRHRYHSPTLRGLTFLPTKLER